MERLKGIGVSEGYAVGSALVAIQRTHVIRFPITASRVARELAAIEGARSRSREQLQKIRARFATLHGADLAAVFDAQLLILDDPMLIGRATRLVRDDRVNAEWAVQRALEELALVFDDVADPYLRERKGDLHDVAGRLRMNVRDEQGSARALLDGVDGPCVLVADELTPSVAAQLDWTRILGFATDAGSRTYHTAILARSLGVPAVVGLHDVSLRVPPGASVIVNGATGEVIIDPTSAERREAELRSRTSPRQSAPRNRVETGPIETADGVRIFLEANVERVDDLEAVRSAGAEGIGLFRSEFLLGGRSPESISEEEQALAYRALLEGMSGRPVTIRTFDVDERHIRRAGDLTLDTRWFSERERQSGRVGLRGIRFGLANPVTFTTQLRALFRAAQHGRLRIMFPFVSALQEVRQARLLAADARRALLAEGVPVPDVATGIMIEVPSAAFMASTLAREVDFFTVGTNDLIQYTLAVDRTDERVSDRYEPLHPAVLRLIRQVRRGATRQKIPVAVCGEMASDPVLLRLLIGCGFRTFSMSPLALPTAQLVVRDTSAREAEALATRVLTMGTVDEIERCLLDAFGARERSGEVASGIVG